MDSKSRVNEVLNSKITVCAECSQASCWQGIFMCDLSQTAGIKKLTVLELVKIGQEHPSYWKTDEELANE